MKGRLDKIVSACGYLSRTGAQSAIKSGRVSVDGAISRDPKHKSCTEQSVITLDGERLSGDGYCYIMLNKPDGVLSATKDSRGAQTVLDLLPDELKNRPLGIVGRLDKDTTGLVLITDNGALNHKITSPKSHADKVYLVQIDGEVNEQGREAFQNGLDLGDFVTAPAILEDEAGQNCYKVTIREGKFHQIKRMFAKIGHCVLSLHRIKIGTLNLDKSLKNGDFRHLTQPEIDELLGR